jgi:hypothetical protein
VWKAWNRRVCLCVCHACCPCSKQQSVYLNLWPWKALRRSATALIARDLEELRNVVSVTSEESAVCVQLVRESCVNHEGYHEHAEQRHKRHERQRHTPPRHQKHSHTSTSHLSSMQIVTNWLTRWLSWCSQPVFYKSNKSRGKVGLIQIIEQGAASHQTSLACLPDFAPLETNTPRMYPSSQPPLWLQLFPWHRDFRLSGSDGTGFCLYS